MKKPIKHGTLSGYHNHKCRCDECRAAATEYERRRREANKAKGNPPVKKKMPKGPVPHGTPNGYNAHKCRCDACKAAAAEYARNWRANPEHAASVAESNRRWREANPEKVIEQCHRWRKANPEKWNANSRQWREANPERVIEKNRLWREANPEKVIELARLWREANPEKSRDATARRRAREADAFIEDVPRLEIFERDGWQCMIPGCLHPGVPASLEKAWPHPLFATIEHVVPLAKGGTHERSNVVCAHLTCNIRKGDREGIRTA